MTVMEREADMLACSVCVSEDWLFRKPRPPQAERWELGRVASRLPPLSCPRKISLVQGRQAGRAAPVAVARHGRLEPLPAMLAQAHHCAALIAPHKARVADNVGSED